MSLNRVVCAFDKECLYNNTLRCDTCTRNINRIRHEDKYKSKGKWSEEKINNMMKK